MPKASYTKSEMMDPEKDWMYGNRDEDIWSTRSQSS